MLEEVEIDDNEEKLGDEHQRQRKDPVRIYLAAAQVFASCAFMGDCSPRVKALDHFVDLHMFVPFIGKKKKNHI